jgi:hypothetical protein
MLSALSWSPPQEKHSSSHSMSLAVGQMSGSSLLVAQPPASAPVVCRTAPGLSQGMYPVAKGIVPATAPPPGTCCVGCCICLWCYLGQRRAKDKYSSPCSKPSAVGRCLATAVSAVCGAVCESVVQRGWLTVGLQGVCSVRAAAACGCKQPLCGVLNLALRADCSQGQVQQSMQHVPGGETGSWQQP